MEHAGFSSRAAGCACPTAVAELLCRGQPQLAKCISSEALGADVDMYSYMQFALKAGLL